MAARGGLRPTLAAPVESVDADRPGDVFQRLLAEVDEPQAQLAQDLVMNGRRDADPAGVGDALEPRRYVDTVPQDIGAVHHHVAQVDADAEFEALRFGDAFIAGLQRLLDLHGAANRLNRAGEFGEDAVTGRAEDAALVASDQAIDDRPLRRQNLTRGLFVLAHLPAVPDGIGRENGGQPAFDRGRRSSGFHGATISFLFGWRR